MPSADADTPETEMVTEQPEQTPQGLSPDKLAELNRTLRDERNQWKREAREAKEQAESLRKQWDEMKTRLGVDEKSEFDPKTAIETLQRQIESERTERLRADVARDLNVDPAFILGTTEDQMRETASKYLDDVNRRIEDAIKAKNLPAAPPASTVTSDGKIAGPQQITSHAELKKLPTAERVKAYKDGRLNELMGKS